MQVGKIADAVRWLARAGRRWRDCRKIAQCRALDRVRDQAAGKLDEALAALERAAVEVDEAAGTISSVSSDLDVTPGEIEQVDDRLFALKSMARKHRVETSDLPRLAEEMSVRLAGIESGGRDLGKPAMPL